MSESEEWAKAVQETAKFGTTCVEKLGDFGGFAVSILDFLDEPREIAKEMITDRFKLWSFKNKNAIMKEVIKDLDERKVYDIRRIHPKIGIPILEYACLEDDEYLRNIWCKLIANSLDPNFDKEIRYAYVEIIRNLTTLDAKILKYIYDEMISAIKKEQSKPIDYAVNYTKLVENINSTETEISISIYNLKRVQCIWDTDLLEAVKSLVSVSNSAQERHKVQTLFKLTSLGLSFIQACII